MWGNMFDNIFMTTLRVFGVNFNQLFMLLRKENIYFESCFLDNKTINLKIKSQNLPFVVDLLQKKCYDYTVLSELKYLYSRALGIALGVVTIMIIFAVLQSFCFKVQINSDSYQLEQDIKAIIQSNNTYVGKSWKQIDCDAVANCLREQIDELCVLSVTRRGVYLVIDGRKSILADDVIVDNGSMVGIFATANGVISRLFVVNGTPLVKVGDTVSVGQMLVAPYKLNDKNEQIPTEAKADIYLDLWDSETIEFVEDTTEYVLTGATKSAQNLIFWNKYLKQTSMDVPYTHYQVTTSRVQCGGFLPIWIEYIYYYETQPIPVHRNFVDEKDALMYLAKQNLLKRVGDMDILEEKTAVLQVGSTYYVTYYIKKEIKL